MTFFTLYYIKVRCVAFRYITLPHLTQNSIHYILLYHFMLHPVSVTLRYVTLRYATLRYITLHSFIPSWRELTIFTGQSSYLTGWVIQRWLMRLIGALKVLHSGDRTAEHEYVPHGQ